MTQDEAQKLAEEYVSKEGFEITGIHSFQHFPATPDDPSHWVVRFELVIPEDVVSGPELLLITVEDETGVVDFIESL